MTPFLRHAFTRLLPRLALLLLAFTPSRALAQGVDLGDYKALLEKYTKVVSRKGEPYDTRFDYVQLYVDEDIWRKRSSDRLSTIRNQLLAVQPSRLSEKDRLAWGLDTYNFLVIERITLNLLVPGRKFMRYDTPKHISTPEGTFYEAQVAQIEGENYSLSGIERRFVYGDSATPTMAVSFEPRDKVGDPRLAFAICKGMMGAGPLLPWPYVADSLDRQLDRAARIALARPAIVRSDLNRGVLEATNWFFDYRVDFGGGATPGVLPFLLKYGPKSIKPVVTRYKLERPTRFFEVDWKLNAVDRPAQQAPTGAGADSTDPR